MTNEVLRKSICASLKMADRRTLKMIKAMLHEYYAPTDREDEDELYEELERRSKRVDSGESHCMQLKMSSNTSERIVRERNDCTCHP